MADNQKIHPIVADVEARPTRPLMAHGLSLSNSEMGKGNSVQRHSHPPAFRSTTNGIPILPYPSNPPKKRSSSCFCKCMCWTISLLILLLISLAVTGVTIYLVFKPKIPQYSVDSLKISDLTLNFDMSLYARFDVKITASNPNQKIGIYYEKGSRLSVWYSSTKLCQGSIPRFYQGHLNTTKLDVVLTGQNQYASALMSALQEQQQTGRIPLDLKLDVPVSIKLGKLKLRKVRIMGTCLLIVDNLSANNLISIKASTCKFRPKL